MLARATCGLSWEVLRLPLELTRFGGRGGLQGLTQPSFLGWGFEVGSQF
jgi:hypothetical protein